MRLRGEAWLAVGLALTVAGCDDFRSKSKPPPPPGAAAPATNTGYVAPYGSASPAPQPQPSAPAQIPVLAPPPMPAATAASSAPQSKAIEAADFTTITSGLARRDLLIRAQVILDRAHFSPGVIDGRSGGNFSRALAAFDGAHNLPATPGRTLLDNAAWTALVTADSAPVTQDYVITADDVKGPFLGVVPTDITALAQSPYLAYASPLQALAEKFHMDQGLLRALNPDTDFTTAGTSIVVVRPNTAPLPPVDRVVVDKTNNEVLAYGAGKLVAQFPATVGSTERPAPTGRSSVRAVVFNPDYTYDPKRLTFGDRSVGVLTLHPGPNNPVGTTWIALNTSTFGIHGTPDPSKIGKTASHGCVRLTNWDAAALGKAVRKGTPVEFVGAPA